RPGAWMAGPSPAMTTRGGTRRKRVLFRPARLSRLLTQPLPPHAIARRERDAWHSPLLMAPSPLTLTPQGGRAREHRFSADVAHHHRLARHRRALHAGGRAV